VLTLNVWFDYYHPGAILYDPIVLFLMYKALRQVAKTSGTK